MIQRMVVCFSFKGTLQLPTAGSAAIILLFLFNSIPDLLGKVTPVDRAAGHHFHFLCIEHFHFFLHFQNLPFVAGLFARLSRCVRCTLRCCGHRSCFRWEQYSRRSVTEASLTNTVMPKKDYRKMEEAASIRIKNACPSGATPGLSKVGASHTF